MEKIVSIILIVAIMALAIWSLVRSYTKPLVPPRRENGAVNVLMGDVFDMSMPDTKVLYMIAMLNELHIGDPGLNLMQQLIAVKPQYKKGILSLRYLMKRKGLVLAETSDEPHELVGDFNSDMSNDEFAEKLSKAYEKAPKAVSYLRRVIKKQDFDE